MTKYAYSYDGGLWWLGEETIKDTLLVAYDDMNNVRIGDVVYIGVALFDIHPKIDVDDFLERMNDAAVADVGEDAAEDYLVGLDDWAKEDLQRELSKAFEKWEKEHNLKPTWFTATAKYKYCLADASCGKFKQVKMD